MASASRKARKTFSGLVARTRCRRTVLPSDMTLFSPLLSGAYRTIWLELAQSLPQGRLVFTRGRHGTKKFLFVSASGDVGIGGSVPGAINARRNSTPVLAARS